MTILLDDYRELTGVYDKLVSIEMIEAVGWKDFGTFFARCSRLLRPDGVMALQAITIDDRLYEVEKAQRSFMNSLIFPNGCLPSRRGDRAQRRPPQRHDDGRPRGHHAALRRDAAALARERRGARRRAWARWATTSASSACGGCTSRFCEAGFTERRIGSVQIVLGKPRWRGHLATAEATAPPSLVSAAGA